MLIGLLADGVEVFMTRGNLAGPAVNPGWYAAPEMARLPEEFLIDGLSWRNRSYMPIAI